MPEVSRFRNLLSMQMMEIICRAAPHSAARSRAFPARPFTTTGHLPPGRSGRSGIVHLMCAAFCGFPDRVRGHVRWLLLASLICPASVLETYSYLYLRAGRSRKPVGADWHESRDPVPSYSTSVIECIECSGSSLDAARVFSFPLPRVLRRELACMLS